MSAASTTTPPPAAGTAAGAGIPATATTPATPASPAWGLLALVPLVFLFAFHLGAAMLSYQKNGSMVWAVVNFIFAYFYYPYYAFFLNTPCAQPMLMGGGRVHKGLLNKILKWKA
jgi:hypothetical protein